MKIGLSGRLNLQGHWKMSIIMPGRCASTHRPG